jgi:SprT-like protein
MAAVHYDLFQSEQTLLPGLTPERLTPPAPATLYTKIREQAQPAILPETTVPLTAQITSESFAVPAEAAGVAGALPDVAELGRMFDRLNWQHFRGKLPPMTIEYSGRMTSAGSYDPDRKLIRIGRKYHEVFPHELEDTLKHEMIHFRHYRHDAVFKAEAARVGASVRASHHPALRRPPRYIYVCPKCGLEYPRQKRLRMASCGKCSPAGRFDSRFKLKRLRSCEPEDEA